MNIIDKSILMEDLVLKDGQKYRCDKSAEDNYFTIGECYEVQSGGFIDNEGDLWCDSGETFTYTLKGETLYSFTLIENVTLRNIKIDVRRPDGTVDVEKNLAFQEIVTGGKHELYCGNACNNLEESKKIFSGAPFLFVNEKGMLSLCTQEGEEFYKCDSDAKEVDFTFERKLEFDFTFERKLEFDMFYKEVEDTTNPEKEKLSDIITDLEAQLDIAKKKLGEL